MQSPNTRYGLQPAALKWLIAIAATGVIALALILAQASPFDARAVAQPTPCPDAIACHALKRMPTQSAVNPAAP